MNFYANWLTVTFRQKTMTKLLVALPGLRGDFWRLTR